MGRLIDADHLKAAFLNSSHVWMSYEQAAQTVDREPTVDARPVIHAHWTKYDHITDRTFRYDSLRCSRCGFITPFEKHGGYSWAFCPGCGARMDEEPENAFD